MKHKVTVCGTSKVFAESIPISISNPDFDERFRNDRFELTPKLSGEFLVAFNHNPKVYREFLKNGGSSARAVLIRIEPDSVYPVQYKERVTEKYGLVISVGSALPHSANHLHLGWPYKYHLNPVSPAKSDPSITDVLKSEARKDLFTREHWDTRSHLLTMVAGNKVSSISNANYSLRRKLAKSLAPNVLEVYGPLWQGSLYQKIRHRLAVLVATIKQGTWPNLREIYGNFLTIYPTAKGPIKDKHALLQDSKFSLVIENSNSIVTEKIFDAIINGSIPIYVGPKLETVGLPSNLAFPISGTTQEILAILDKIDSLVAWKHLQTMLDFIESPLFWEHWEASAVYKQIAYEVIEYLSKVNSCK
jgi:hypothetical protein